MDYKKLHKETLEKLQQIVCEGRMTEEVAKNICPDFVAESEDERIRKELIEQVEYIIPNDKECDDEGRILPTYYKRIERYRTYLEKYKEQKPAENGDDLVADAEEYARKIDCGQYGVAVIEAYIAGGLKERTRNKPAEWSNEEKGILVECISELQDSGHWLLADRLSSLRPQQNPSEWSEEDERMLNVAIRSCEQTIEDYPNDKVRFNDCIAWLKFISLNLKKKNEDIAKLCSNEWSEEDENKLNHILEIVHIASGREASIDEKGELESFLKSLRPQPHTVSVENATKFGCLEYERGVKDGKSRHWKPSEEQMCELNWASKLSPVLESLYNDLKKLM